MPQETNMLIVSHYLEILIKEIKPLNEKYTAINKNISDTAQIGYFSEMMCDILNYRGISYPTFEYELDKIKGKSFNEIGNDNVVRLYRRFEEVLQTMSE